MKKVLMKIIICLYIIVTVLTTASLLTYNKQNISEFGGKIFLKLKEDMGEHQKGSLLIANKTEIYMANDQVFYCQLKKDKCIVSYGNIDTMMGTDPMISNQTISKKLIIAKDENIKEIPLLGSIMLMLESRIGYLCVVVLPILIVFLYELFTLIKETKKKK